MDVAIAIFTQLGVDSSLPYQFLIISLMFLMANFLFLGKLQSVIETREEKTTKLESSSNDAFEKVQKMQSEYAQKIEAAQAKTLKENLEKKQALLSTLTANYKESEKKLNQEVDVARTEFSKEVESAKEKYLSEADQLASSLVNKIIQ